eukprot:531974_1
MPRKYNKNECINIINNENNIYYNNKILKQGLNEYLTIPKLVAVSSISADQMHGFYGKSNKLLSKNVNYKILEDAVNKLLKGTIGINYEDIHYNNDVLLALNRLIQFDVNNMPYKCSKLSVNCLVLFSVNNIGAQLLMCKYLKRLFVFYKYCINEYIFNKNDKYKDVLLYMCIIIGRIFEKININDNKYSGANKYKLFKYQCIYYGLFELYNANILIKISNVFREIDITKGYIKDKIFDGFVNVLVPIASLLKEINNETETETDNKIYKLVLKQLDKTKCGGILNFMSKLVFYGNSKLTFDTIVLLNGCISYLNCICKINIEMLELHILEYEMEIYHIFKILLEFTSKNFMIYNNENKNNKNNNDKKK